MFVFLENNILTITIVQQSPKPLNSWIFLGWFTQIKEEQCRKDYNYSFSADGSYVIWRIRERRGNSPEQLMHSAVYVDRPFLSPVDVTERRNLVYNFRSLLARDTKGHLSAGIYFPVLDNVPGKFTMFYTINDVKKRVKLSFSSFKSKQVSN